MIRNGKWKLLWLTERLLVDKLEKNTTFTENPFFRSHFNGLTDQSIALENNLMRSWQLTSSIVIDCAAS